MFRERYFCLPTCRMDYPSDISNIKAQFSCFHCEEIDSARDGHWKSCVGNSHLRENKVLTLDVDLCEYYRGIINMRIQEQK